MAKKKEISSWHVGVAAEAFAAAQFARMGVDVSVQYGANQPEYDLIISKGDQISKISVKGSQDGSWGLSMGSLKDANYQEAANLWLKKHGAKTIFCFVQFEGVKIDELPRMYLATPKEVAQRLKDSAGGRGDTILYEHHEYKVKTAAGFGTIDKIPNEWKFTKERFDELIDSGKI